MNLANYTEYLGMRKVDEIEGLKATLDFYETMKTRRSIREFSNKEPSIEVIKNAIMTAGTAPNGANKQPWFFGVIRNPDFKRQIRIAAEEVEERFYEEDSGTSCQQWINDLKHLGTDASKPYLESGATLIAIFAKLKELSPEGELTPTYYPMESTCIAAGMLISSLHQAGIATLTHTPKPMKFLNELLGLENYYRPLILLVAGYPKEPVMIPKISKKRFEEIAEYY